MACKKGFSGCDAWDGHMNDCPGCDIVKSQPRAECSACGLGLTAEIRVIDKAGDRYLDVKMHCPNHGYIKYKGLK